MGFVDRHGDFPGFPGFAFLAFFLILGLIERPFWDYFLLFSWFCVTSGDFFGLNKVLKGIFLEFSMVFYFSLRVMFYFSGPSKRPFRGAS